jgi:hypothetical protein
MTTTKTIQCTKCATQIHPLEVFPNNVCLPCHASDHENDTPEQLYGQIMGAFGGQK